MFNHQKIYLKCIFNTLKDIFEFFKNNFRILYERGVLTYAKITETFKNLMSGVSNYAKITEKYEILITTIDNLIVRGVNLCQSNSNY